MRYRLSRCSLLKGTVPGQQRVPIEKGTLLRKFIGLDTFTKEWDHPCVSK